MDSPSVNAPSGKRIQAAFRCIDRGYGKSHIRVWNGLLPADEVAAADEPTVTLHNGNEERK
jgi:hypothetical protein